MISYRFEETIRRPADEIWLFAADITRHPQWMAVTEATILSGDSTTVGARGREIVRLGPFRWAMEFEVIDAAPGRRITWRATGGGPGTGDLTLDLEPVNAHETRAIYRGEVHLKGLWRLFEPIMAKEIREGEARELQRSKALLEEPAPAAG
jgi:carbon monoxide dehydrogenase subunit G